MASNSESVGDWGERRLIGRITEILGYWGNELIPGPDDAVAFPPPASPDHVIVMKTDMLVGKTDVPPRMTLYQAGRKAVIMNASDLYVKGVQPRWILVALGLPPTMPIEGENGFEGLIQGVSAACHDHGIRYLGGDLGETDDLIISITIGGESDPTRILRRSSAKVGDIIVTTGQYGMTGVGFDLLLGSEPYSMEDARTFAPCITAVLEPSVDPEIGREMAINGWATAAADSSDGLFRTIEALCEASHVGARLEWEKIPIFPLTPLYSMNHGIPLEDLVGSAGEEYHHIFTIPPDQLPYVLARWPLSVTPIGTITPQEQKLLLEYDTGECRPLTEFKAGYQHFQ
jgi:thiamine-monophosphate kinase